MKKERNQFGLLIAAMFTVYQFQRNAPHNGEVSVEGPWYPQPHKWYARVTLQDGVIVRVT